MKKKAIELVPDDWVNTPRGFTQIKSVFPQRDGTVKVHYAGIIECMVGKTTFNADEEIEIRID